MSLEKTYFVHRYVFRFDTHMAILTKDSLLEKTCHVHTINQYDKKRWDANVVGCRMIWKRRKKKGL